MQFQGLLLFFCICLNSPNRVCLKMKRRLPNIYKENVSCGNLFMLLSQVCVYLWGLALYPIQEGSKSQGPQGSNRLQTPCELPEGNLGLIGSALPQHPWQHWTPSKTCHIDETDSVASRSMNMCSGGRRRKAADPSWILFPWGVCHCAF